MWFRRCVRSLAAAAAGLLAMSVVNQSNAADTPQVLAPLLEHKAKIAAELAKTVRVCVARKDTGHPAFHGCIDWHSAVHGVWALTAYARMTGDKQDAPLIAATLGTGKIAAERNYLRAHPDFEMPYGRAWFLRLADEQLASGDDSLKPMADEVLASMLAYYRKRAPDPRRGSYASDAWALINMHDYAAATSDATALAAIRGWVEAHFVKNQSSCDYALETGEFMAVCTNWAWLVSKVLVGQEFDSWASAFFERSGLPRPVLQPVNWHHHGLNFSRAWGLWHLYAASGQASARQAFLEAYVAHFRQTYERPQQWRGSYEGVGHWVPQFGMLALQPLFAPAAK
jgi:Protein of unknown function (DUF2891)